MPFANPPGNATVRTASIWSAEDLAPLVADLQALAADHGRGPLDVHFGASRGGTPGEDRFDPGRHREQNAALAEIGVTAIGTGTAGGSLADALRGIETYGEAVLRA